MAPRYRVTLTNEEWKELETILTKGKMAARTLLYARALFLLDAGESGQKWIAAKGLHTAIVRKRRIRPPWEIQFGVNLKYTFWHWPVRIHQRVKNAGQYGCWLKT